MGGLGQREHKGSGCIRTYHCTNGPWDIQTSHCTNGPWDIQTSHCTNRLQCYQQTETTHIDIEIRRAFLTNKRMVKSETKMKE